MYKRFKDLFESQTYLGSDALGDPASQQLRISVVGLLWEAVFADGKRAEGEFEQLVRMVEHEFHLMDSEVGDMVSVVDFLRSQRADFDKFLKEVNTAYTIEQREHLLKMMLEIMHADGHYDRYEQEFIAAMRTKLRLPALG